MTAQEALAAAINGTVVSQDITVTNAATILAALSAAGWAMVPRDATEAMLFAGTKAPCAFKTIVPDLRLRWTAMLAAAQAEPPAKGGTDG